ncbi:hypothetical protein ACLOJK_019855 [Asimina triloba]
MDGLAYTGFPLVSFIAGMKQFLEKQQLLCLSRKYVVVIQFVAEVQETIRPTLNAYLKGNVEALKKNCSPEVIERCRAEHRAYESQGIFFDNKFLLMNIQRKGILHQ